RPDDIEVPSMTAASFSAPSEFSTPDPAASSHVEPETHPNIAVPPLSSIELSTPSALPPGGASEGMLFSASAPALADSSIAPIASPDVEALAWHFEEQAAPSSPPPPVASEEAVVPFVERRSSAPIATRAIYPAPKPSDEDHM